MAAVKSDSKGVGAWRLLTGNGHKNQGRKSTMKQKRIRII